MITEVQLLAYRFAAIERTRYSINRVRIEKNGRVVGTDGKHAIFIEPGDFEDAGNEQRETMHIKPEMVIRALDMMRSLKLDTHYSSKPQPIKAVKITDDGESFIFDQNGTKLIMKHYKDTVNFPDADGAVAAIDPKQDGENCRSVFINATVLKEVITVLCQMIAEDNKGIELSFSSVDCNANRGFRIDAKGRYGEKITYFLMQMSKG